MLLVIIFALIVLILWFNLFVYLLDKKIAILERKIVKLFQRRTSEMVGIYQTTKKDLVRASDIFSEFFDLKRREFAEDSFNVPLENKIITYKRVHNEINFIFKTCEKHRKIQLNPIYIYLRDWIIDKSQEIWKNMRNYEAIKEKYDQYKSIARLTLIWYLY